MSRSWASEDDTMIYTIRVAASRQDMATSAHLSILYARRFKIILIESSPHDGALWQGKNLLFSENNFPFPLLQHYQRLPEIHDVNYATIFGLAMPPPWSKAFIALSSGCIKTHFSHQQLSRYIHALPATHYYIASIS